jgi:hypothetical protein
MKVNNDTQYHAHPNYQNDGPWQDWNVVSFGTDDVGLPNKVPCRLLLFYQHQTIDAQGSVMNECRAIVQSCKFKGGTVHNW